MWKEALFFEENNGLILQLNYTIYYNYNKVNHIDLIGKTCDTENRINKDKMEE